MTLIRNLHATRPEEKSEIEREQKVWIGHQKELFKGKLAGHLKGRTREGGGKRMRAEWGRFRRLDGGKTGGEIENIVAYAGYRDTGVGEYDHAIAKCRNRKKGQKLSTRVGAGTNTLPPDDRARNGGTRGKEVSRIGSVLGENHYIANISVTM